jgi:hypothetical protein
MTLDCRRDIPVLNSVLHSPPHNAHNVIHLLMLPVFGIDATHVVIQTCMNRRMSALEIAVNGASAHSKVA